MIPPAPVSAMSRRQWLREVRAGDLRRECGIRASTVARAAGAARVTVHNWETGRKTPTGPAGEAYLRFVAGLVRHLAVTEDDMSEAA